MQLSRVLAPQVTSRTRTRGAQYAADGAVTRITRDELGLSAIVVGELEYEVRIQPSHRSLLSQCTCPFFADRWDICKHIWAAILIAEERGLPLFDGAPPAAPFLEAVPLDEPLPDDDDDEPDFLEPPPRRITRAPASRGPEPWRKWLAEISASAAPLHPPPAGGAARQLIFVLDIATSALAGAAAFELMTRERKVSGEWGKPKPAGYAGLDLYTLQENDRALMERLLGARNEYELRAGYVSTGELTRFQLMGALAADLLPLMCADGRCFARVAAEAAAGVAAETAHGAVATALRAVYSPRYWQAPSAKRPAPLFLPLVLDEGPAWEFAARIIRDDAAAAYQLEGSLRRGDQHMAVSEPLLVLADGWLVTRTHIARLDHRDAFAWLAGLRKTPLVTIPLDAKLPLLDALLASPLPMSEAPQELRVEAETVAPRPLLRLTPASWKDYLEAAVLFAYEDVEVEPAAARVLVRSIDGRVFRRDIDAEQRLVATLHTMGFREQWSPQGKRTPQLPVKKFSRVVRTLLAQGWRVEARGIAYRTPGAVQMSVSSGIDWFHVNASVEYDGQSVPLPTLLAALRRGDNFVQLDDGSHGLLPDEWLRRQGALARLGLVEGTLLRFKPSQVALLDALLAAQPAATCDAAFDRARRRLASFDGIKPADPPASFVGALRGYQREGLGWLQFLREFGFGGCLADDMGLGKTVMVLALLARVHGTSSRTTVPGPSLVVAPRSLVFNWRQEAERFTPSLRVLEYTGGGRHFLRNDLAAHDVVLTTYGTLRRDAVHLSELTFEYVVLDEAQAIKNASSVSAKATRLLKANHRLALSGTPIENHLGELWSLFEFLNPGVLGSAAAFSGAGPAQRPDEETLALLSRGLRPFILRRTKTQVAPELPEKTEQTIYCELEPAQRRLYDELKEHYRRTLLSRVNGAGVGRMKLQVLEALLRLRQAACHPGLIDTTRAGDGSAKLDVLVPQVQEATEEGHKVLVFSQFTSLLAIVRRQLDAAGVVYEYLDGRTRDREARVHRFQTDPECRLFLISLKAGGVGLNLTAAEYVFLLDPWWNPAVEAQAIDRTHRIGQSRHVFAYRLIAKDTVEERVLELQRQKRSLADAVLKADASLLRELRREDLELLLS